MSRRPPNKAAPIPPGAAPTLPLAIPHSRLCDKAAVLLDRLEELGCPLDKLQPFRDALRDSMGDPAFIEPWIREEYLYRIRRRLVARVAEGAQHAARDLAMFEAVLSQQGLIAHRLRYLARLAASERNAEGFSPPRSRVAANLLDHLANVLAKGIPAAHHWFAVHEAKRRAGLVRQLAEAHQVDAVPVDWPTLEALGVRARDPHQRQRLVDETQAERTLQVRRATDALEGFERFVREARTVFTEAGAEPPAPGSLIDPTPPPRRSR